MYSTAWAILGLVGLAMSSAGALLFALKGIKSRKQILEEKAFRAPTYEVQPKTKEDWEKGLLKLPAVKAALQQSKIAKIGVSLLASGFFLQLVSASALFLQV